MQVTHEFCLTTMEKDNPWTEKTTFMTWKTQHEHTARRKIIDVCLSAGMWVVFLISVEDLTD